MDENFNSFFLEILSTRFFILGCQINRNFPSLPGKTLLSSLSLTSTSNTLHPPIVNRKKNSKSECSVCDDPDVEVLRHIPESHSLEDLPQSSWWDFYMSFIRKTNWSVNHLVQFSGLTTGLYLKPARHTIVQKRIVIASLSISTNETFMMHMLKPMQNFYLGWYLNQLNHSILTLTFSILVFIR